MYNADGMLGMGRHKDVTPKRVVSTVQRCANGAAAVETWLSLVCERLERLLCEPAGCFEMRMLHRQPLWTAGAERTAVSALGEETSCNIRTTAGACIPLAVPLLQADECGWDKEVVQTPHRGPL